MPQEAQPSSTANHHPRGGASTSPMAGNTKKARNSMHWTNEKHVHFLNNMEASFIRSMFGNNSHSPPLDRYLPDSSESTQDLGKNRRTTRYSTSSSDIVESNGRRTDKKTRILSHKNSSKDQVVPQFENRRDDDKDKEDNDASISFGTVR